MELRRPLAFLAVALAGLDAAWALAGHVALAWSAYGALAALALGLMAASVFYVRKRPDPRLAAMLFGAGFLCAFSAAAGVLNYLLLPLAGPRIDEHLAALDRALGFDWPRVMMFAAAHPLANRILYLAYSSMLPQVALAVIVLARAGTWPQIYRFCAAVAAGALICIGLWALAPSFGAFSVYPVPAHMALALDGAYARELVALLRDGPGFVSPANAKGLIGFPSYHAVLALLVTFYAWKTRVLRYPVLALNILVLLATPIQGGHHLIDVLAAFPVALLALFAANAKRSRKSFGVVNESSKFTLDEVPNRLFRILVAQDVRVGTLRD